MNTDALLHNILNAIVFSGVGLLVYVVGFILLDRLTPQVHFWRSINEDGNVALAIFLGSIVLGIAIIIGAAVRG